MNTVIYLYNEWDALAAIFALIVFFAMTLYGLVVVLTGELGMTSRTDAIHMVLAIGIYLTLLAGLAGVGVGVMGLRRRVEVVS